MSVLIITHEEFNEVRDCNLQWLCEPNWRTALSFYSNVLVCGEHPISLTRLRLGSIIMTLNAVLCHKPTAAGQYKDEHKDP